MLRGAAKKSDLESCIVSRFHVRHRENLIVALICHVLEIPLADALRFQTPNGSSEVKSSGNVEQTMQNICQRLFG